MLHYRSLAGVKLDNTWLTIGSFDGVHLGHQAIIHQLVSGAKQAGASAVAFTFHPHPAVVLGKRQDALLITDPEEKAFLLNKLGVDVVITYPFTKETAQLTAEQFVAMLHDHLGLRRLFVGQDFALGHGREGNVSRLGELGEKSGYQVEVIPPVKNGDIVISSSQIRSRILNGEILQAERLLGRRYTLSGRVVPGDARGKMLGIPTANLSVSEERMIPKAGVYVCRAFIGGEAWGAVANIGVRPTFEDGPVSPRVEAHLINFNGDLYGLDLSLEFVDRLRDEQRFSSIQSLVEQIHTDIARAREVLAARDP
ncbi:MAG: bifunctional riboflavin kinase/FAD synthetase [Anaerolineales bacterium]